MLGRRPWFLEGTAFFLEAARVEISEKAISWALFRKEIPSAIAVAVLFSSYNIWLCNLLQWKLELLLFNCVYPRL